MTSSVCSSSMPMDELQYLLKRQEIKIKITGVVLAMDTPLPKFDYGSELIG